MEEGAQEVGAAHAHIKASLALARPEIGWYDLDLKRYMMWNCSIFVCIRSLQFPQLLIKTRLQAQHKVCAIAPTIVILISTARGTATREYGMHLDA